MDSMSIAASSIRTPTRPAVRLKNPGTAHATDLRSDSQLLGISIRARYSHNMAAITRYRATKPAPRLCHCDFHKAATPPATAEIKYNRRTAWRSLIPSNTRRCELWSFAPTASGRPLNRRVALTSAASNTGRKSTSAGIATIENRLERCSVNNTELQPRKNPTARLPVSPMKTLAG